MKGISVITNFGCPFDCPYCVWKGHPLEHRHEATDWRKLEAFLTEGASDGCDHVSVSGGGEPLYRFRENRLWWGRLAASCKKLNLKIDIHTRMRPELDFVDREVRRLVLSSDRLGDVKEYALGRKTPFVRVVHVVTAADSPMTLLEYVEAFAGTHVQLSFKKLHGGDDRGLWRLARNILPGPRYIEDKDYNRYFMPDNTVTEKFL